MTDEAAVTIDLNPREQRFYDRIRTRVAAPNAGTRSGMRDVLLMLPDLTVLLMRLVGDRRVPLSSKVIAIAGVGYALSPVDLVPTLIFGPLGLVDDLLVVTAALSRLLNHVHPDVVRSHWSGKGDALDSIQRATSWSETFLTQRIGGTLRGWVRSAGR